VYVADTGNSLVKEIPIAGGGVITLGSGFNLPDAIAVDSYGNVYVADRNNSAIKEIPAGNGPPVTLVSGLIDPYGVAVDASGNVFYSDRNANLVRELPARSTTPVNIGSGFSYPYGLTVDGAGNVYVADYNSNYIKKVNPIGGYHISAALPASLIFNNTTGAITGKPTVQSPATNYTITAYNSNGSNTASVNIQVKITLPTLNYGAAKVYTAGTAITPLVPAGTGVAAPAYKTTVTTLGFGAGTLQGLAVDAADNLYVADASNNAIDKIPLLGGNASIMGAGLSSPKAVAVDATGNLYVSDYGNNSVKEILAAGGNTITIATGFSGPQGIAVDAAGNVYVADTGNGAVDEIFPNGTVEHIGSGFNQPAGVAVDAAGNVYVADSGDNAIKEIPLGRGAAVSIGGTGFVSPSAITVDASGNLFVSDQSSNPFQEILAGGGGVIPVGPGTISPLGIAVNPAGIVYVTDPTNVIKEIDPAGGYYVSAALPVGLSFNNSTGVISGTPTVASPVTIYTVTAYNPGGGKSAAVSIKVNLPALPTLSYGAARIDTAGSVTTPLTPTSTGVTAWAYSTGISVSASGFNSAMGLAVDAQGNIYVADNANNAVKQIPAGGGAPVVIGSGFLAPHGVAVDAAGNVYVADTGNGLVKEVPAGGGAIITLGSGFSDPFNVAVDAAGNVYVADFTNNAVKEIQAAGGAVVTLGSGFSHPAGVAVDAAGNIYVADYDNSAVKEIPASGGPPVTLGSGFSGPWGISVDASNNVFVADFFNGEIKEIPAGQVNPIVIRNVVGGAPGVATDTKGNVYLSDFGNNNIEEIKPVGGYYINALPAGLSFNNSTGAISGIPTAARPATNYTVTAYNYGGGKSATVNIKVSLPAVPTVSYGTPQVYTAGAAITPLPPTSTGVAPAAYSTNLLNLGSGFRSPISLAVDGAGNVYVADNGNNAIKKIPAGGGAPVIIGSGFINPYGVAVDAGGNVYVADSGNSLIKEIPVGGGAIITLGSGFADPFAIAVDAAGNVFVADYGNNAVKEIQASGGGVVTLGGGFAHPSGVAVDAMGNVYVGDYGNNAVKMIPAGDGAPVTLGAGINNPWGVAVDASGNVFVGELLSGYVKEIPAGQVTPVIIGLGGAVTGVATDRKGDVYLSNIGNTTVEEIKPVGGYYINAALPPGLNFANATGIISGVPQAASAATNYTVTAYSFGVSKSASVNIKVSLPPAPTISYVNPPTYVTGIAITPAAPVSTGVAAAGYATGAVDVGSGFSAPFGLAIDVKGNIYVADYNNSAIKKVPAGGGIIATIGSGFSFPAGVAVDALGNVYVADTGNNAVKEIPADGGAIITLATIAGVEYIAVDYAGNVYAADFNNSLVKKIPAGGGAAVNVGSGFSHPSGLAVDGAGNVFVADFSNNVIKEILASSGATITVASGFTSPISVAVDATGNLFVGDESISPLKEIPAGGGSMVSIGPVILVSTGVTTDGAGNLYVSDHIYNKIKKISPVGGYYISSALPAGLSFSNATGTISGTPTVASPATNYTVTAYNFGVSKSAVINIGITKNANLANLTLSSGTLAPVFAAATTSYTASVANATTSIKVTPTTSDAAARVKVNGAAVTSGTASAAIPLAVGVNTISTVVTAQDGATTKAYTLKVTRAAATNANLSALGSSVGGLTPVFAGSTTSYTLNVGNATASMTLKPVSSDGDATLKVNGAPVTSGTVTAAIPLTEGGQTMISVVVTAANGTTTKTYALTVTRAPSSNANLSNLHPNNGTLSPVFAGGTISYTASVANPVSSVTLTPTAADASAAIKVNGTPVTSGTATAPIALTEGGQTVITTVVTSQDGTAAKTYTLTVTRAPSGNATLSNLQLNNGTLTPVFATGTVNYSASVANNLSTITITPTITDANATIKVNGTSVTSGTASGAIALAEGAQTVITTVVTAQDGATTKTYTVTVTRAPSTDATLAKLGPGIGGLTPAFSATTTSYTISTGNANASTTLTPVSSDANATIKVNGTTVASGTTTAPIVLAVGPNTITTVVTAQNGTTTKTYTLTVTRAASGADGYVPIAIGTGISVTIPIAIGTAETPTLAGDGIQVHQGVSPNGDGINDFLQIDNISQYPDNKLMIMNRNGQLIYEARGYDNSSKVFDGHSSKNGQMQLPGTYFYQLDYTVNGITKHKTGFIMLKY